MDPLRIEEMGRLAPHRYVTLCLLAEGCVKLHPCICFSSQS
jgi:hypothetical protein